MRCLQKCAKSPIGRSRYSKLIRTIHRFTPRKLTKCSWCGSALTTGHWRSPCATGSSGLDRHSCRVRSAHRVSIRSAELERRDCPIAALRDEVQKAVFQLECPQVYSSHISSTRRRRDCIYILTDQRRAASEGATEPLHVWIETESDTRPKFTGRQTSLILAATIINTSVSAASPVRSRYSGRVRRRGRMPALLPHASRFDRGLRRGYRTHSQTWGTAGR